MNTIPWLFQKIIICHYLFSRWNRFCLLSSRSTFCRPIFWLFLFFKRINPSYINKNVNGYNKFNLFLINQSNKALEILILLRFWYWSNKRTTKCMDSCLPMLKSSLNYRPIRYSYSFCYLSLTLIRSSFHIMY